MHALSCSTKYCTITCCLLDTNSTNFNHSFCVNLFNSQLCLWLRGKHLRNFHQTLRSTTIACFYLGVIWFWRHITDGAHAPSFDQWETRTCHLCATHLNKSTVQCVSMLSVSPYSSKLKYIWSQQHYRLKASSPVPFPRLFPRVHCMLSVKNSPNSII